MIQQHTWLPGLICCGLLLSAATHADIPRQHGVSDSCDVVVKLFGAGAGNLDSYGSGTLISKEGHVVTVWNHLINTGYLTAVTSDGQRFQLDVVGTSAAHDLAVLKLRTNGETDFPSIDRTTAVRPEPGGPVRAFSNMFHVATGNEPVSVVHGIIATRAPLEAGFGRWKLPLKSPVLILDAITNNSGAAGGLLADIEGRPLGLLGRELRHDVSGTWVNYAVPFDTLNPVIDTILAGGTVDSDNSESKSPPVSDRQLTAAWGLSLVPEVLKETPAYIDRVVPGSTADKAGFERGDLVVLVDDQVVQTGRDFRQQLAAIRSGLRVTVTVSRDGVLESIQMRVP